MIKKKLKKNIKDATFCSLSLSLSVFLTLLFITDYPNFPRPFSKILSPDGGHTFYFTKRFQRAQNSYNSVDQNKNHYSS